MLVHGAARATQDIDFCYARSRENTRKLASTMKPFRPRLRGTPKGLPFAFDEETIRRGLNFTLSTDLGDIDFLGEVAGLGDFKAVRAESRLMDQFGRQFYVLTVEGLLRAKRAAGRKKDEEGIHMLESLREMELKRRSSDAKNS